MDNQIQDIAAYLQRFLAPGQGEGFAVVKELAHTNLPIWVTQLSRIYESKLGEQKVVLIDPKEDISVDQGARLHKIVFEYVGLPTLLIADRLPIKGRGTLVRLLVPHVIGNHTIFAPDLGLQYRGVPDRSESFRTFRPKLPAFAVKIASYYLLNPNLAGENWTLSKWQEQLRQSKRSLPSFSRAFIELMENDLVEIGTLGASKQICFRGKEHVWQRLVECSPEMIRKKIRVQERPKDEFESLFKYAGESALAKMSDLNEPLTDTIAMGSFEWNLWWKKKHPEPALTESFGITIEVWNMSTVGFPMNPKPELKNCVSPIELALSLRNETDPRIHECVQQMLGPYGLDAEILWSRK